MPSAVAPRSTVEVTPTTRRVGGWLANSNVIEAGPGDLQGAQYETDACVAEAGGEFIDECLRMFGGTATMPTPATPTAGDVTALYTTKTFQAPLDVVTGDPFTVFVGTQCFTGGLTQEGAMSRSERRLGYVEDRQVDYHIARMITAQGNDIGDCPLSQMLMNADYTAVNEYGGVAMIGMSRPLMICAASEKLIWPCPPGVCADGATWQTANGTLVFGIAHDDRVTVKNFFLTGAVTLIRSAVERHVATDMKTNQNRGLAERVYVPLIECMAYYGTATCDAPVTP